MSATVLALAPRQDPEPTLAKLEQARLLLQEVRDIQGAKKIHDLAKLFQRYAGEHKLGVEVAQQAGAIAHEALRRIGELLSGSDRAVGGQPYQRSTGSGSGPVATLAELGISKKLSARAQQLYRLPSEFFEQIREGRTTLDKLRAKRPDLFKARPDRHDYWRGMPEYSHDDQTPYQTVKVHLANAADREAFEKLMEQTITDKTRYIWHPKVIKCKASDKVYTGTQPCTPRYPVYIVSKGRWESRLTSNALDRIKIPYHIVVEPQEYDQYAAVIDPSKILVTPFSNLGQGSIPVRNFVWEHATSTGAKRHWILDDNIDGFARFHKNMKIKVDNAATFCAAEDFTDRYENIALSGFHYDYFAPRKRGSRISPVTWNTRIYSGILIRNDIPYRWRGRYNEDTDLSLRVLKDDWVTVLFNAFLMYKQPTLTMKGGNTDELYRGDGRKLMAESLRDQHPDCVTVAEKWGRWQHHVDYSPFKDNTPVLRPDALIPEGTCDYGMTLVAAQHDERTAEAEISVEEFPEEVLA